MTRVRFITCIIKSKNFERNNMCFCVRMYIYYKRNLVFLHNVFAPQRSQMAAQMESLPNFVCFWLYKILLCLTCFFVVYFLFFYKSTFIYVSVSTDIFVAASNFLVRIKHLWMRIYKLLLKTNIY